MVGHARWPPRSNGLAAFVVYVKGGRMFVVALVASLWFSAGSQHRNLIAPGTSCIPTSLAAFERSQGLPTVPDAIMIDSAGRAGLVTLRSLSSLRGWASVDVSTSPEGCSPCLASIRHIDGPVVHAVLLDVDGDTWRVWDPWGTPSWGGFGRLEYSDLEGGHWHDFPAHDRWRMTVGAWIRR